MKNLVYTILLSLLFFVSYGQICLKNPYDFSFTQNVWSVNQTQTSSAIGDFDNDGKKDIVTGGGGSYLLFFKGDGTGKYLTSVISTSGINTYVNDISASDFNNDGKLDIALAGDNTTNTETQTQIALGDGSGNFTAGTVYNFGNDFGSPHITSADFNNDNFIDIKIHCFTPNWNPGGCFILKNNGGSSFTASTDSFPCGIGSPIDYNHDGDLDMSFGDNIYLGHGNYTFDSNPIEMDPNNYLPAILSNCSSIGQLNNDTIPDYIIFDNSGYTNTTTGFGIIPGGVNTNNSSEYKFIQNNRVVTGARSGDFNGDGLNDIACLFDPFGLEIFINQGGLNFTSVAVISTAKDSQAEEGRSYSNFLVSDVNNDGKDDIILPGDKLGILLGNPLNIYNPYGHAKTFPSILSPPHGLATGDFNHDGKMDFACASTGSVMATNMNNGNGTFNFYVNPAYPFSNYPNKLYSADLNNDGNIDLIQVGDLILTGATSNKLIIHPGTANGVFGTPILKDIDANNTLEAYDLTIGDFNNDNLTDIVTQNNFGRITVFLNTGNFTFSSTLLNFSTDYDITSADFNMDGNLDLLSFDNSTTALFIPGNGNGTFGSATSTTIPYSNRLCTGDFNGDGKKDFCSVSHLSNGSASKFLGNGNGTFQSAVSLSNMNTMFDIYARDLNGDNKDEIFVTREYSSDYFTLKMAYLNANGTNAFNEFFVGKVPIGAISFMDVDNDGREDVLVSDKANLEVVILYNNSAIVPITTSGTLLCNNGVVAVNMPVGQNYVWSTGSISNPCIINTPGTYVVTSTNFSGSCSSSDTFIVNSSALTAPTVSLSASASYICQGNSIINLSGSPSGGIYSGAANDNTFEVQNAVTGMNTIYYNIVDLNGCGNSDSVNIFVDNCVFIESHEFTGKDAILIYPNPARSLITIQSSIEHGDIIIYNSLGIIVHQLQSKNTVENIDISKISSGVYVIQTKAGRKIFIKE